MTCGEFRTEIPGTGTEIPGTVYLIFVSHSGIAAQEATAARPLRAAQRGPKQRCVKGI